MKRSHSPVPCQGIQRSHAAGGTAPSTLVRTVASGLMSDVPPPAIMDVLFHALRSVGVSDEELPAVLTAALALIVLGTLPEEVVSRVDQSESTDDME